MGRKRLKEICSEGSFDSFLSTVTKNGLGMLVLVAMASTFSSQLTLGQAKFRRSLGTPIIKPAPLGLKPEFLECRGNRILPVELSFVQQDVNRYFNAGLAPGGKEQVVQDFNALHKSNDYHLYAFESFLNNLKVHFRPRAAASGFSHDDIKAGDSAYGKYVSRWNVNERYLYFFVRPDSFPAFREAREIARARGYQVGWEPLPADKDLTFFYGFGPGSLPTVDQ
jgi:hypothetical protein